MPQIFHFQDLNQTVTVWKILEPISFFIDHLPSELHSLPFKIEAKNLEWLAARYLLYQLLDSPIIKKDANKKPVLVGDQRYISISHTSDIAAVMVATKPCGIDVEKDLPRIHRIAHKFLSPEKLSLIKGPKNQSLLYQVWCAKEVMYKAYGLGGLDFKHDLTVDLNALLKGQASFNGQLSRSQILVKFLLKYEKPAEEYHLVYGTVV